MTLEVDNYIAKHSHFSTMLDTLRQIILSTNLEETIKWGMPTYTYSNKNILSVGAYKNHYGIWFFQGALLEDKYKVLISQEKTKAMRQLKFTTDSKIDKSLLLEYIGEAISNEKKGLKVKLIKNPIVIPPELGQLLEENKKLAKLFESLALGKKREFSDYISDAKREATKVKRLEKIIPLILNNIGLHDKYKNC